MNEIKIASWQELIDRLFESSWNPEIKRFRSPFVFRGLSDENYKLKTSLMRLGGPYAKMEKHLLRNFRKYAIHEVIQKDNLWTWLAVAQHYGLPTRLLDWTYSPLVATHFATSNIEKFDKNGIIWYVDVVKTHTLLPEPLKSELIDEGSFTFTIEMLAKYAKSLNEFDNLTPDAFLLFFEPPSLDNRIINQSALFSVISNPEISTDKWLVRHKNLFHKIIIPASLKWEIRDNLDKGNISERVLFPGLEGLTRWLKRYYYPKDK